MQQGRREHCEAPVFQLAPKRSQHRTAGATGARQTALLSSQTFRFVLRCCVPHGAAALFRFALRASHHQVSVSIPLRVNSFAAAPKRCPGAPAALAGERAGSRRSGAVAAQRRGHMSHQMGAARMARGIAAA